MWYKKSKVGKNNMFFNDVEIEKERNNSVTDGDLIRAYIGNKNNKMYYKTASKKGFNIWAFLFGMLYFLYRKLYITSIVFGLINVLIVYVFEIPVLVIGTNLIAGVSFYKIYGMQVEKKIDKLKYENLNLSSEELLKKCSKQGGRSAFAIILFIVLIFVLVSNCFNIGKNGKEIGGVYVCDSIDLTNNKMYMVLTDSKDISYSNYYNSEDNYINGEFNVYKILKDRYLLVSYSNEIVEDGVDKNEFKFLIDEIIMNNDDIRIGNKYTCIRKDRY